MNEYWWWLAGCIYVPTQYMEGGDHMLRTQVFVAPKGALWYLVMGTYL
jgi:hypothetical protein